MEGIIIWRWDIVGEASYSMFFLKFKGDTRMAIDCYAIALDAWLCQNAFQSTTDENLVVLVLIQKIVRTLAFWSSHSRLLVQKSVWCHYYLSLVWKWILWMLSPDILRITYNVQAARKNEGNRPSKANVLWRRACLMWFCGLVIKFAKSHLFCSPAPPRPPNTPEP